MTEMLRHVLPEAVLIVAATAMYVAASFADARRVWPWAALSALVIAALTLLGASDTTAGIVRSDMLARSAKWCFLSAGLMFVGLSWRSVVSERLGEFYASLLLIVAGTMLTTAANDLVLLFLGLELISIPTYVLLYLVRHDLSGQEAAMKYFFLSVLSSALLLYGFSFLYGLSGSTNLDQIARAVQPAAKATGAGASPLLLLAMVLIFAGLGFKITVVPFHFYAPDVYQGTTSLAAGLLAFAPKAAGILALLRVAAHGFRGLEEEAGFLAMILAVVTMTGGNVLALMQDHLRRLLAYSSIAHAGYMLIALGVGFWDRSRIYSEAQGGDSTIPFGGNQAVLFYLVAYALATVGAFGVSAYLSRKERQVDRVDDLAGLSYTHPLAALAMAAFLFSLTGIWPLAGFWAKLGVFSAAVSAAGVDQRFLFVAAIGVVNAAIAAFYYLRIVITMYLRQPVATLKEGGGRPAFTAVIVCALLTFAIGVLPQYVFHHAADAARDAQPSAVSAPAIAEMPK